MTVVTHKTNFVDLLGWGTGTETEPGEDPPAPLPTRILSRPTVMLGVLLMTSKLFQSASIIITNLLQYALGFVGIRKQEDLGCSYTLSLKTGFEPNPFESGIPL